jgi:signal transduction histidine kinase
VSAVLWVSIAILALALAQALRLLRRSGEARVAVLAALVVLLAVGTGALLVTQGARPLAADAPSAAALALLGASGAAWLGVRALAATLEELELAEALHWGSMQGVRALTELAADRRGELDERLASLLDLGRERFGLEVGWLARIEGERFELRALRAPAEFPVAAGDVLDLGETVCRLTAGAERPVAVERVSETAWARPPGRDPLGLEAYLGALVTASGRPYGTLVFASRSPATQRFTASQKDLLALMAQWAGFELERQRSAAAPVARAEAREPAALAAVPRATPRRSARRRAGIDVDEVLRRVERRIRELVEPRVRLLVRTGPEPALARDPGVPLESLLLTLVGHAVDAMPTGGTLTLSAASLAGDATRYVTLSVAHTGRGPDADALARAFDPGRSRARDGLGLASLVRALRRGGGDLSVEVDPARGSTFTVFLPADPRPVRAADPARGAVAPPPPPGH